MTRLPAPSRVRRLHPGLLPATLISLLALSAPAETKDSCVWKLTADSGAVAYLAGSVHLLRPEDYPLPPTYDAAYEKSNTLYFEVDMQEMNASQAEMLQLSKLPDGKRVEDVVSEKTYAKLQRYFDQRGIGGEMFETMSPGMLAMTIHALEAVQMGALPQFGVEMVYDRKARADDKPIEALETVEFQIDLFNEGLSREQQGEFLSRTLDEVAESAEMISRMIEVWKAGEAEKLAKLMHEHLDRDSKLTERVLYERNRNWIEPIEKELDDPDSTTLFIVGTGHLVGEESVIDLLEKKGYQLEQLTYED